MNEKKRRVLNLPIATAYMHVFLITLLLCCEDALFGHSPLRSHPKRPRDLPFATKNIFPCGPPHCVVPPLLRATTRAILPSTRLPARTDPGAPITHHTGIEPPLDAAVKATTTAPVYRCTSLPILDTCCCIFCIAPCPSPTLNHHSVSPLIRASKRTHTPVPWARPALPTLRIPGKHRPHIGGPLRRPCSATPENKQSQERLPWPQFPTLESENLQIIFCMSICQNKHTHHRADQNIQ